MANKKRIATSVAAVATAAALLLGGTFAWQSANQTALNEASDVINPGGRLHDDFSYTEEIKNKDVYVENFAEEEIFARVRIEEYFEITMNKGTPAENNEILIGGEKTDEFGDPVYDENGEAVKTYTTFTNYDSLADGTLQAAVDGEGTAWWSWETGGETVYMPTFNLNKDSLQADINGTYAGLDVDPDAGEPYDDYIPTYSIGDTLIGTEVYDADANNIDDDGITEIDDVEHTAKATGNGELISMADWDGTAGPYWVYDADGWVYWAQPIQPDTATGLLLDNIALNQVMDDSWYYAINVVAQFVTADDLGKTDGTGFYDDEKGTAPSPEALALLEAIGVNTDGPVMVSNAEELQEALANGENVIIDGEIEATEATEDETGLSFDYNILWHEGGTVNGGELTLGNAYQGLFINNENNWPVLGDGANPATMNDTAIYASRTNAAVYAQAIDAPVTLNNVSVNAGSVGVWAEYGNDTVTLNNCEITSRGGNTEAWLDSAVAASYGGHVIINGGTYTGDNAVYVYSSGGTIEINGGTFNGELHEDAGELIIRGGTFDHNPTAFVDAENYDVTDNGNGTWTVSEKAAGGESDVYFEIYKRYPSEGEDPTHYIVEPGSGFYFYGSSQGNHWYAISLVGVESAEFTVAHDGTYNPLYNTAETELDLNANQMEYYPVDWNVDAALSTVTAIAQDGTEYELTLGWINNLSSYKINDLSLDTCNTAGDNLGYVYTGMANTLSLDNATGFELVSTGHQIGTYLAGNILYVDENETVAPVIHATMPEGVLVLDSIVLKSETAKWLLTYYDEVNGNLQEVETSALYVDPYSDAPDLYAFYEGKKAFIKLDEGDEYAESVEAKHDSFILYSNTKQDGTGEAMSWDITVYSGW